MSIEIRGTRSEEEVKRKRLLRDTRGLGSQLWDALGERDTALLCLLVLAVMPFVQPLLTVPCAFLGWGVYRRRMRVYPTEALPFRLPKTAGCEDPNDPKPGRESGNAMASGIFFLGREHGTRKQLWLKAKDMLTHMLVFGTTGSGKTEFLVSMAFNALAMGSGFSYVDPKGAPKLPFQIYTMCRMLGRDDDFRIMNYNTGGKSVAQHGPKRMSNSQNPFAFAPADAIVQLIVSLIPKSEGGNAIFAQNAQVVISGINTSKLTVLKEKEKMDLLREIQETGSKEAKDKLINGNLRLVLSVIQKFTNRGEDIDDLFQIGVVGLIKAINNFDLTKEVRFSTYCVPMIAGELRRYLRDYSQIKVSRSMKDLAYKAMQAKERLTAANQREPKIEEIAKEIGAERSDVVLALESISDPVSLYEPVYSDSGDTLYVLDQIGDKNDVDSWLDEISLKEAIRDLHPREKNILYLRFFQGKTQVEVANEIGISQAQVSRLEKGALAKVKGQI